MTEVFPFVGREAELGRLDDLLHAARHGKGRTALLRGGTGLGKSRLAQVIADRAREGGWRVAIGRAFPVESAGPYAIFTDALSPVVTELGDAALKILTRGSEEQLAPIFPFLSPGDRRLQVELDPSESKTRLLWNFAQFLIRLAHRQPLFLVFEDLHWADDSSIELLHFVARQLGDSPVANLCVQNDALAPTSDALPSTLQSLLSLDVAELIQLSPFSHLETTELISRSFEVGRSGVGEFADRIHKWTGGNPHFVVEVLKSLVDSGQLRQEGNAWVGWSVGEVTLPISIRESIAARITRLSDEAQSIAEIAAVIGTRVRHEVLDAVGTLSEAALLQAVEELLSAAFLQEVKGLDAITYEFIHPALRDSVYSRLSQARAQKLHRDLAESLERFYGEAAVERADELAFHLARSGSLGPDASRALLYLVLAGRNALARQADDEAAKLLKEALTRHDQGAGPPDAESQPKSEGTGAAWTSAFPLPSGHRPPSRREIVADLARALVRSGDHAAATDLWNQVRAAAQEAGDPDGVAAADRRLGLVDYWRGARQEALEHFRDGLEASSHGGDQRLRARLLLVEGLCLMETGNAETARVSLERASNIAEKLEDIRLEVQIRQILIILHTWTGPPEIAREHGEAAASLADALGSPELRWSVHWALAALAGLTGDGNAASRELAVCESISEALRSPLRRLWTSEISLELAWATGEWNDAVALGESSIKLARALGQATLLPRMLVLTAFVHFGRGDTDRGRELVDEAWEMSKAGEGAPDDAQVAVVVPAYTGMAGFHLMAGEWDEAIRIGTEGLAIADRSGYVAWGIHRLLPIIAEAQLQKRDLEGAREFGARLRSASERLGHKLGLAWADACDAIVAWLSGDVEGSIGLLEAAADALDDVPYVPDAARLRRQLAGRLAELGDREGALAQLRRVHDVFQRVGAEPELKKTRRMFVEIGSSAPRIRAESGVEGLSGRELGIARLVADRMSNKAIGKALGISHRTVSTHLSNIYQKMGVTSRGELTDLLRRTGTLSE